MTRPFRILDIYCGAGGAAKGYADAGCEIVGVDFKPQPRYPYAFICADALGMDLRFLRYFDAIHASPPCQFGTELNNDKSRHLNLIPPTRALLQASGRPYIIENVRAVAKHLIEPVSLFGTMFDNHMITSTGQRFNLSRERCFETDWGLSAPDHTAGTFPIANVFGGHLRARGGEYRTGNGTGRTRDFIGEDKPALARALMGMPWANMMEMSEAIPPSYTSHIGRKLIDHLREIA